VRAAAPGLPKAVLRALTVALMQLDLTHTGRVSFLDVQQSLRLCSVVRQPWKGPPLRLDGTAVAAPLTAPPSGVLERPVWELEEVGQPGSL
jgi:hypothetical protein